ncbi:MAG: alpha-mannosidase [Clostridia bacterium]|nr:alpha-mannosidase [Clostridia bacterium]
MIPEYERAITRFAEFLPKRIYHPAQTAEFTGFFTFDHMTLEEAEQTPRQPMPDGLAWGVKWEYGWFFTDFTVPAECEGKHLMFHAALGECIVFVNGKIVGSLDREHSHISLTKSAKAGEHFSIAMEVYAGHSNGFRFNEEPMLLLPELDVKEFPEGITQQTVKNGSFGVFFEDGFQLWMDIQVLMDLRQHLSESSLRYALIDKALVSMYNKVDIEAPHDTFLEQVKEGRELLRPVMEAKNGTSAPVGFAASNSHLDLEWLWTKEETRRKAARTIGNQITLMKEYPDYKYVQGQPWLLASIKEDYPELYAEVKEAVKRGQFLPDGGMWVQSDTNMPMGESLIRQFLVGKKFIQDEFGIDSKIAWLPDTFGATGALPQIMKGCGVDYFFSSKLKWQYNGGDPFPQTTFIWEGVDGSEVLCYVGEDYAAQAFPSNVIARWNQNVQAADVPAIIFPYGWGDGGGGATRVHLEAIRRQEDLEGAPKLKMADPMDFFRYVENECTIDKKVVGELYYSEHRGSYTSQGRTKLLSRKSELGLRDAEFWSAILGKDTKAETDKLWKEVLFNHFHDILPGTSIQAVHDRAEASFQKVIDDTTALVSGAVSTMLDPNKECLTVFNSLSWERTAYVTLPEGYTSLGDCPTQKVGNNVIAQVTIPACGCIAHPLGKASAPVAEKNQSLVLANNLLRAEFNENGFLISLMDQKSGTEFIDAPSNMFKMYRDLPSWWDPTDLESHYQNIEIPLSTDAEVQPEYCSDLYSSLTIKRKVNNSDIFQRVILRKDCPYLEFETEIDWHEDHKLLKLDVATNIHAEDLVSEIQYGHVKRPTHRNRKFDQDRFEVSQHRWSALCEAKRGVALLNDCKYGISALGGRISLTLLKSFCNPVVHANNGHHKLTFAIMPFTESLADSGVIQAGYELNCPISAFNGCGETTSFASLSHSNIILEWAKQAEDGSGDIILRLYESTNSKTVCTLNLGFAVKEAYLTNMAETEQTPVPVNNNQIPLTLGGFEVITLRLKK